MRQRIPPSDPPSATDEWKNANGAARAQQLLFVDRIWPRRLRRRWDKRFVPLVWIVVAIYFSYLSRLIKNAAKEESVNIPIEDGAPMNTVVVKKPAKSAKKESVNSTIKDGAPMNTAIVKKPIKAAKEESVNSPIKDGAPTNTAVVKEPTKAMKEESVISRPYVGARDANGNLGYTFDPSPLRFGKYVNTSVIKKHDEEKAQQYSIPILPRLRQGLKESREFLKSLPQEKIPKILCIVYTCDKYHSHLEAIRNTWANDCDGFFAASNKTVESLGAVDLIKRGEEAYGNMWQKTRSILNYAHDNFRDEYDFFYVCGDDVYVLVDNLRAYTASDEYLRYNVGYRDAFSTRDDLFPLAKNSAALRPRPLLIAMPYLAPGEGLLPYGGNGYALNRAALEYSVFLDKRDSSSNFRWNLSSPAEDFNLGLILRKEGIVPIHTQDKAGGWRLFGKCIKTLHNFVMGNAYDNVRLHHVRRDFNVTTSPGVFAFSNQTVSFHLKSCGGAVTEKIYRYHSYFL